MWGSRLTVAPSNYSRVDCLRFSVAQRLGYLQRSVEVGESLDEAPFLQPSHDDRDAHCQHTGQLR